MALSEHEQRLLEEMERSLYRSESDVMSTTPGVRNRPNYRAIVIGIVLAIVGAVLLVVGVAMSQIWIGLLGFVAMLGGVLYMSSPSNQRHVEQSGRTAPAQARESSSERMERRWEERQEGER